LAEIRSNDICSGGGCNDHYAELQGRNVIRITLLTFVFVFLTPSKTLAGFDLTTHMYAAKRRRHRQHDADLKSVDQKYVGKIGHFEVSPFFAHFLGGPSLSFLLKNSPFALLKFF
jgi:hypothetical protein